MNISPIAIASTFTFSAALLVQLSSTENNRTVDQADATKTLIPSNPELQSTGEEFRAAGEDLTDCRWESANNPSATPGQEVYAVCDFGRQVVSGGCICTANGLYEAGCVTNSPLEGMTPPNIPETGEYVDTISWNGGWVCTPGNGGSSHNVTAKALCCVQN